MHDFAYFKFFLPFLEMSLAAFQTRNSFLGTVFLCSSLEALVFSKRFHSLLGVVLRQPILFPLMTFPPGSLDMEFCAKGVMPLLGSVRAVELERCSCGCLLSEVSWQCQVGAD